MPRIPSPLDRIVGVPVDVVAALRLLPTIARDTRRMDERMANIEAAMPVLVAVQQHLSGLPETMTRLDAQLTDLGVVLQGLLDAVGPIAGVASRLPGGRAAAKAAARASESQATLSD